MCAPNAHCSILGWIDTFPTLTQQPFQLADAELQTRRDALQRELQRAQIAGKGVLLFTFALAVVAVWLAHNAFQQTEKVAEVSRHVATERARAEEALWQSQIARASAVLESGKSGGRMEAL